MKIVVLLPLVSIVAGSFECDWVPTLGCGGTHHVCKLRATLGWGAFDREEAEGIVDYLQNALKLFGLQIRRVGDFGGQCSYNWQAGPFVQGKNFCCKLFL